ncbi:MAG: NAD(P)H-hydrate dehydratase [Clostridia bacterium]|nr:NAD(P)H-hydrate dehydratase [Clostridia bacterium]
MRTTVVTVGDMRRLEQAAVDGGLPYETLMERAGAAVAEYVEKRYSSDDLRRVLVLCGNGNNGGDGFVVARHLMCDSSRRVTVALLDGHPKTALAQMMLERLPETVEITQTVAPSVLSETTLVVDGVYGIGFHGRLSDEVSALFSRINELSVPVAAIDVPSGLHADDGTCDPAALRADLTVTFTALKPAMALDDAMCLGTVVTADIGIDAALCEQYQTSFSAIDADTVKGAMAPRPADGHKGTFGRVLSVCGSYGMAGAAMLCGKAALRCGVGLLDMAVVKSIYPIVASQLWEAVFHPLDETANGALSRRAYDELSCVSATANAVVVGCGLSRDPETAELLKRWLPTVTSPLVLDADGLNIASEHIVLLKAIQAPLVLTPHPAEAARLLGLSVAEVQRDRAAAAKRLSATFGAVVVLKGHRTLVALPSGELYINMTGNAGMATGGSGDVLTGVIAALLAQGMPPYDAARAGAYYHGLAGEAAAKAKGSRAVSAWDVCGCLRIE